MHTSNRCEENIDTALLVIINCINISGFVFLRLIKEGLLSADESPDII